jgi:heme-degrading monooxygenase HmoA
MFIVMNRFRVRRGDEAAFEEFWRSRETYLPEVPGFIEFHFLKAPGAEDHTLYASHTVWESEAAFEEWTRSEAFRAAHRDAWPRSYTLGGPALEMFEVLKVVTPAK